METFISILKIAGILFVAFVLFQAYFNMWTPIFWLRKEWGCRIIEFVKDLFTPATPKNVQHRILIQEWNDSEFYKNKKHNWPGAVAFQLQSFKKKYLWSKPAWILMSPGTGGGTMDLKFVNSCVTDWHKSYPDALIINHSETFKSWQQQKRS